MSNSIDTQAGGLSPGQIKFYDSIQPPLTAGTYQLEAVQEIKELKEGPVPPFEARQTLRIDGPRFKIDPTLIHMVFPPANQEGSYAGVLPNIVFKNFALPWSRNIDPKAGTDTPGSPPWMGLLSVYDDEMPQPEGRESASKISNPLTVTVKEIIHPPDDVLAPDLGNDVDTSDDEKVLIIDMDLDFFRGIAPKLAELPFLAHAREVNTDGKAMLGMTEDGCFSVLVGNRVVKKASKNTIFLVSLEGHQAHLPDGGQIDSVYTKIRLLVLGSWSFTAADSPGSFIGLMQNLDQKGRGGVKLFQMPLKKATNENAPARKALEIGFVPLQNDMRAGEKTTSWYRGPLVPAPTKRDSAYGPYHYSDHAIHYDPDCGIFNLGYAAAWQIGRLLALSDGSFAKALFDWRRSYFGERRQQADRRDVEAMVARAMALGPEPARIGDGLAAHMQNFWTKTVAKKQDRLPMVQPRAQDPGLADLPGVLSAAELEDVLTSGVDPIHALIKKISESIKP